MPYRAWNKGLTKESNASLARIATARKAKNNFSAWHSSHPVHYALLKKNAELAFLIGLILGDGHVESFPRTQRLVLALGTDKPALWKYAASIVEKVFLKKPTVVKITRSECVRVSLYQKGISERLKIPHGSRGHLTIKTPAWIKDNKAFLIAYLKGLFEAEGSFCIHLTTCTYNFAFANHNISLLDTVESSLLRLGFTPRRRPYNIALRKRAEALAFEKLISFRKYPKLP